MLDETQKSDETGSGTFFGTIFSLRPVPRLFSIPIPRLFSALNFSEADSGTFPVPNFFYTIQKIQKSRERDETDTKTQTDTKILTRNCEVNMRKGYKRFEQVK